MSEDLKARLLDWQEHDEGKINDARHQAVARIEELEAKLENLTIAIGMGWDLDGVVCEARAALASIKENDNG